MLSLREAQDICLSHGHEEVSHVSHNGFPNDSIEDPVHFVFTYVMMIGVAIHSTRLSVSRGLHGPQIEVFDIVPLHDGSEGPPPTNTRM